MATVKITPHTYSADSDLKNLCAYIVDPLKTANGYYSFGRGVEPERAFEDFCEVQRLYGKVDGQRAYHIIVSFDPAYCFTADEGMRLAHAISSVFFPQFQVLCGVHPFQGNLHAHFAVNTVSIDPALTQKLHIGPPMIAELRGRVAELEERVFNGEG